MFARGEDLVIRVELAGVDRDHIDSTPHDNTLTISGERENDLDEVSFYTHERFYGAFSMTLPAGIDESRISAYSENGMLEITVRGGAVAEPPHRGIGDKPG